MLNFYVGPERKSITKAVLNRIAAHVSQGEKCMLVVPEQYSYDAERLLCGKLGCCSPLTAESISFSRLAERAEAACGAAGNQTVDEGGKYVLCISAMELALPRLKYFAASMNRPELVMRLVQQVEEFKRYGVSWQKLRELSACFDGVFSQKLLELSLIYECYETVSVSGSFDPSDRLAALPDLIWENNLFSGISFFFDGFTDFTVPQLRVIETLLRAGADLNFSFVLDYEHSGKLAYLTAWETVGRLKSLAGQFGVRDSLKRISPEQKLYQRAFYMLCSQSAVPDVPDACYFSAGSKYEESKRAVSEIQKLVMSGYRYRDITVACSNPDSYLVYLRPLFRRLGIPASMNERYPLSAEPLVQALLAGVEAAVNCYDRDSMLRFLKSPFSPVSSDEADLLENYVFTWNITGKKWEQDWTMSYGGYRNSSEGQPDNDYVNTLRIRCVDPISSLRAQLQSADSCASMTKAVYDFWRLLQPETCISNLCDKLREDAERVTLISQIPGKLLAALEQLYAASGMIQKRPEEFVEILRNLLSVYTLKNIPATLDAITFGSFDSVKYKSSPCLILLGCEEGSFPSYSASSGIFSDYERELLNRNSSEPVCNDCKSSLSREISAIYDVLCTGGAALSFLWTGENESYLVKRMREACKIDIVKEPSLLIYDTLSAAAEVANLSVAETVRLPSAVLEAAKNLCEEAAFVPGSLSPEAVQTLYGSSLYLSASKADQFSSCHFAYFMKYGLELQEQVKAEIDPSLFGTMTHEVLERTLKELQSRNHLHNAEPSEVAELCDEYLYHFLEQHIPDYRTREERFRWLLKRNREEIHRITMDAAEEFRVSDYDPAGYEFKFNKNDLIVTGQLGTASITGYVDRVDTYREDGQGYFRIVDYKTGTKKFLYSDVLEGMGMQMLVYLFALSERKEFAGLRPSGVLYVPAKSAPVSLPFHPSEEEITASKQKEKKRSGILLNDDISIGAMEHIEDQFVYLPLCFKKGQSLSGNLADGSEMKLLHRLLNENLQNMTDSILSGVADPNPWRRAEDVSSCSYCPYRSVCRKSGCKEAFRILKEMRGSEFFDILRKKYGD